MNDQNFQTNQEDLSAEQVNQGFFHLLQKEYSAALQCFQKAAELGNPVAMNNISVMYANGEGVEANAVTAFEWMKRAAEGGHSDAYYPLALKYYQGKGTENAYYSAEFWAKKALAENPQTADAAKDMLSKIMPSLEGYRRFLWKSDTMPAGNLIDQGVAYFNQNNLTAAFNSFMNAAQQGNPIAMNNVSFFYATGKGTAVDKYQAFYWMRKSAELGYTEAFYPLACKYFEASGVPKSLDLAEFWANKTIEFCTGNDQEQAKLLLNAIASQRKQTLQPGQEEFDAGNIYHAQKQYTDAFLKFAAASHKGHVFAMNNLSIYYINGHGCTKDLVKSFEWMKKSAEGNYREAYAPLAYKYANAVGTAKSDEQANYWAQKSINTHAQNKKTAQNVLDKLAQPTPTPAPVSSEADTYYNEGLNLYNQKKYEEALTLLEKAGKQGHAAALCLIGQAYHLGNGVPYDIEKACDFYLAAAFRGSTYAIQLYARNIGSSATSYIWKFYAQYKKLKNCEQVFTNAMLEARKSQNGSTFVWDAKEAMIKAVQYWRNYDNNPNRRETISTQNPGSGAYAASIYFYNAIRYGNIDAICGLAKYHSVLGNQRKLSINLYKMAAYLGHSYAMYRLGQHYDTINQKAANACYRQAAIWQYEPAIQVCIQRGIPLD